MKKMTFKKQESEFEVALKHELSRLSEFDPKSEDYQSIVKALDVLSKLDKRTVSADTIVLVGANLLGILLILNHERANVITTKAFGLLSKGRI